MRTTNAQVRKLMEEMNKHGKQEVASIRAGMDPKTARKYLKSGKWPSELVEPRNWRTRDNPFEEDWPAIVKRLEDAPELEAKALFEDLMASNPDRYNLGQLRTFQRHVRQWRAQEGPAKEVFFPQAHRPGEAFQTDFTWLTSLGVTINGEAFPHMLCHVVLPFSNWEWGSVCRSESMSALIRGIQAAVFRLGRVPRYHQTDNSTAATHNLQAGKRAFNDDYLALMKHLGMEARTIGVGKKEQNGDIEAINGALKRRLKQHLILRGDCDFRNLEEYERWLWEVMEKANHLRQRRFSEEFAVMQPISVTRLPEYTETRATVGQGSTIRVKHNIYSVPSRLMGEEILVRVFDDRLEVFHGGTHQFKVERLLGKGGHRIYYRHIIESLVRKPGAFERYKYRDDLFPTVLFRRAYDALAQALPSTRKADLEYLRILHLAASTMESEVETALEILLSQGILPISGKVKELVNPDQPKVPEVPELIVNLRTYDDLLGAAGEMIQ